LTLRVFLSCGEASGDLYAGALVREMRALVPDLDVFGLGGREFARAGGRVISDCQEVTTSGLTEPLAKLPQLLAVKRRLLAAAEATPPAVFVPIDFWGFNYRLARAMKVRGIPVAYYISPQLWASRPWRMRSMRRIARRVLVIFPFEEAIYRKAGVPVEFVGHPLVDLAGAGGSRQSFREIKGLAMSAPTVAVLPGSRPGEVTRILPGLVAAAQLISTRVPTAQFVVARAQGLDDSLFEPLRASGLDRSARVRVVEGDANGVLGASDVAILASGTATVQAALHDTPMVIVYRVSPWTYRLGRPLVTVDTFGMVNLIAGQKIVPELIQNDFTPEAVAREAVSMLTDAPRTARIRDGLRDVRRKLGEGGASRRAAQAILEIATPAPSVR
jgi:lipid-A-disaccharide synthase